MMMRNDFFDDTVSQVYLKKKNAINHLPKIPASPLQASSSEIDINFDFQSKEWKTKYNPHPHLSKVPVRGVLYCY